MRDLHFQITGVDAAASGLTPLMQFQLQIRTAPATDTIQALLLNVQIQLQPPQRAYNPQEKERLFELFGSPEQWGQTLRNRLWTHATVTVGAFTGSTETLLPVPCTYDLNAAAAKYFYALEGGEVPLLLLFSGSIFYATPEGRLQVERISWSKECSYRLPVTAWRGLMERLYPNCAWLYLRQDVFDHLYAYKRRQKLATWEETLEQLLEKPVPDPFPEVPQ